MFLEERIRRLPSREHWGSQITDFQEMAKEHPDYPGVLTLYAIAIQLQQEAKVKTTEAESALERALWTDRFHLSALDEMAHLSYSIFENEQRKNDCIRQFLLSLERLVGASYNYDKSLPVPPILTMPKTDSSRNMKVIALRPENSLRTKLDKLGKLHDLGLWKELITEGRKATVNYADCDSILLLNANAAVQLDDMELATALIRKCVGLRSAQTTCAYLMYLVKCRNGEEELSLFFERLFLARLFRSLYWFGPMLESRLLNKWEENWLVQAKQEQKHIELELQRLGEFPT